jgi:hypothetical protein
MYFVKESLMSRKIEDDYELLEPEQPKVKTKRESKTLKDVEKEKKRVPEAAKVKLEIKLSGNSILAGNNIRYTDIISKVCHM